MARDWRTAAIAACPSSKLFESSATWSRAERTSGRSTQGTAAAVDQTMTRRLRCLLVAHAAYINAFQPPARRLHQGLALRAAADADVNSLMTQLNAAVQQEDFRKAAELKKKLDALRGDDGGSNNKRGDWASRGAPGWLQARLQDLGMRFPHTGPRSSFRSGIRF